MVAKRIIRWSLVSAFIFILVWSVYFFAVGPIPTVASIDIFGWKYIFPFAVSHLFDILLCPIYSALIVFFMTRWCARDYFEFKEEPKYSHYNELLSLIAVLAIGLLLGLYTGFLSVLVSALIVGVFFYLYVSISSYRERRYIGREPHSDIGLAVSIVYVLTFFMGAGLAGGLAYGLIYIAVCISVYIAIIIAPIPFHPEFWRDLNRLMFPGIRE